MEHVLEELTWALWGRDLPPLAKSRQVVDLQHFFKNVKPQASVGLLERSTRNAGERRGLRNIFGLAICDKAKQ